MRKRLAWIVNLANIGVLSFMILNNYSPLYGATACTVAVSAILVAVIPGALKEGEVYNDEI